MKRIVEGRTYNTDTSIRVAKAEWIVDDQRSPYHGAKCEGSLHQTRRGAFFLITAILLTDESRELKEKLEFAPMTAERAQAWLLERDVEVYRNPFGDPPEAAAETETGATIYIRVPAALKRDVDQAAGKANVSTNVWTMRCVEHCLEGFPKEMTAIWAIARNLSCTWDSEEDAKVNRYRLKTSEAALSEIADLVEIFAQRRFGTDDLSKINEAESFLLGPEQEALSRRFRPYED